MRKLVILLVVLVAVASAGYAADYSAAVMQLPESDAYVALFNAIGAATGHTFAVEVVPPARAAMMIETKKVDVIFPATKSTDPQKNAARPMDLSAAKVFSMVFVLYANKGKPASVEQLRSGNPGNLQVETTASLASLFEFKPVVTTSVETSLKKVDAGRVDGLVYAQEAGDPQLKNLGLHNIVRSMYSLNEVTFGIQKGQAAGALDKVLVDGISKLKADGRLDQIISFALKNGTYNDWQP